MSLSSKIVLWILIIASVAISALWLAGGKKPEFTSAIKIDASPENVFPSLIEPEKLKSWMSGISHVEKLEPKKVDSRGMSAPVFTLRVVNHQGKEQRFQDEVIRFEENKELTVQSSNANQVITSIFKLEPDAQGTQLSYRVTVSFRGMGRILAPLQSNTHYNQGQIDTDVRVLKERIESRE